jgi:hypothetical protein
LLRVLSLFCPAHRARASELSNFCVFLQHLPELALPHLSSLACAFVGPGVSESLLFYYRLFPLFMLPVWNAETNNAKHQAELIYSSSLGVSYVL